MVGGLTLSFLAPKERTVNRRRPSEPEERHPVPSEGTEEDHVLATPRTGVGNRGLKDGGPQEWGRPGARVSETRTKGDFYI